MQPSPAARSIPALGSVHPAGKATLSNTDGVTFKPSIAVSPAQTPGVSALPVFAVQLGGNSLDSAGTVSIVAATLDLTAALRGLVDGGRQFVIIQAGAPVVGTFDNLLEGSTISDGLQNFTISYANDRVTLTAQPAFSYLNGQTADGTAATFVHNLYRELLGREPDAPGQAYWVNVFQQISGTSGTAAAQQTVAADFLGSSEYHQRLVQGIYLEFLRRAADAGGLAFWTAELAAGMDEKNVLAYILGSDEYFGDAQPRIEIATNPTLEAEAWVGALYRDLLGRTSDPGAAYWVQETLAMDNPVGRTAIALQFLSTSEVEHKLLDGNYPGAAGSVGAPGSPAVGAYALADITGNGWDNLYFQGNLSAAAVDSLFAGLQSGTSYEATISTMLGMTQYFDDNVQTPPF